MISVFQLNKSALFVHVLNYCRVVMKSMTNVNKQLDFLLTRDECQ